MTYGQAHANDHNQGMRDLKRQIDNCPKDQLAGLLKALCDEPEINQSVYLLALIMRGSQKPRPASSMGGVSTVATLAELAPGMLYQEPEGKRQWMRIVEIGPVQNFDNSGAQQYRDAVTQPAFSHMFVSARPCRIFGYERPFKVKVAVGREPK